MKNKALLLIITAVCFVFYLNSYAGEYAADFLSIGVGARPLAMGGAFVAAADDASSACWNPAGIAGVKGVEVSSVKLINTGSLNRNYTYLNAVYNPGEDIGVFGASYLKQSFGGIKIISSDGIRAGSERETSDNAFVVTYARVMSEWLSAGINLKAVFGAYPVTEGDVGYLGLGFDLGIIVNAGNIFQEMTGLKLGFNLQDPYTTINWKESYGYSGESDRVAVNLKVGAAYDAAPAFLERINMSLGLSGDLDTRDNGTYHAGAEIRWNKFIFLRSGIKGYMNVGRDLEQGISLSFGAGVIWDFLSLDYAYAEGGIEPQQYVSLTVKF